jgi:DNA-binding LacI/PurR family transcriptional regulator
VNLLRGMREAADEAEKQILLLDFKSNKGWEKADGILICDWSNELTMRWLPPQMPSVSVLVPAEGMVSVYADDYSGGRLATEYLLKLGHRRIAHLHSGDPFVSRRRLAGHRDALRAARIEPDLALEKVLRAGRVELDFGQRFVDTGREIMQAWLQDGWKATGCTAIVAQNDETAIGVIETLRSAKIRVPEDVSVFGFDGVEDGAHAATNLTTMQVPLEEIGKTAMQLLLRQLNGEDTERAHRVYPLTVKVGESTAPPATL